MARKLFVEKASLRTYEMHASESHFRRLSKGVAETHRRLKPPPGYFAGFAPDQ